MMPLDFRCRSRPHSVATPRTPVGAYYLTIARRCLRKRAKRQTGVQYGLDLDDRAWRTRSLWNSRNLVAKSSVIDFVDEDAEESSGLFV